MIKNKPEGITKESEGIPGRDVSCPIGTDAKSKQKLLLNIIFDEPFFRFFYFFYLVLGAIIIVFDMGNTFLGQLIADFGCSIIPQIKGTAEITSAPASSATVLSIAWLWGFVMFAATVLVLRNIPCQEGNWDAWNRWSLVKKIGIWVGMLVGIYCNVIPSGVPKSSAGIGGRIFSLLSTSPLYTVLWGMAIWLSVWIVLIIPTVGLISLVKNNRGGRL